MENLSRKYIFIILFILTLIGIELRLAYIDLPLWYDEAHSVLVAKNAFPFGINNFLMTQDFQHTPFYFYILHFWINLFGESDITLKILSLIFGIGAIPLTYIFARKFTSVSTSIIATIFVTFNSLEIIYATEVRMYSLIVFLALLSMIFLFDFLKNQDKKSLIGLSIVNILIPYTFTGAALFVIAQIISVLIFFKSEKFIKKYLISNLYVLTALIPYFIMVMGFGLKRGEFLLNHTTPFCLANIFGIFQNFLAPNSGTILWATLNPFYINLSTLLLIYIPLFVMVYFLVKTFKSKNKSASFLFCIILLSIAFATLFAINQTIVLAPRYLIFISPFVLILTAFGLKDCKKLTVILFVLYYSIASSWFVYQNKELRAVKTNALMLHVNYIKSKHLTNQDMLVMPFASSVIGHYLDETSPKVPRIEAIQDLRIYNNENIYSKSQIEEFETQNINKVFQKIILSDNYISENFHNYILKTFVNPVPKGRYILMSVFSSDAEVLIPDDKRKEIYSDYENVENDVLTGILAKYFVDINKIIQEKAELIDTQIIEGNVYFLYKKKE